MKNSLLFFILFVILRMGSTPVWSQEASLQNRNTYLAISEKKITNTPEEEEISEKSADSSSDESSVSIDPKTSHFIYQTSNLSSPSSKSPSLHDDSSKPFIEKSSPPTQHPIERKTVKAITGYGLGCAALLGGIQAGGSLSVYLGLSLRATIGVSVVLGLVLGAITIHYTWDSINSWFATDS